MSKIALLIDSMPSAGPLRELCEKYLRQTQAWFRVEVIEYGGEKIRNENEVQPALQKELTRIEKHLQKQDKVILLSEKGKCMNTEDLAGQFEQWLLVASGRIVFVIGSPRGFHSDIYKKGWNVLSLSPLTFPHELALVICAEQLYRLCCLRAGKTYHY